MSRKRDRRAYSINVSFVAECDGESTVIPTQVVHGLSTAMRRVAASMSMLSSTEAWSAEVSIDGLDGTDDRYGPGLALCFRLEPPPHRMVTLQNKWSIRATSAR